MKLPPRFTTAPNMSAMHYTHLEAVQFRSKLTNAMARLPIPIGGCIMKLLTKTISCPHCGHHQRIDLDTSSGDQDYYHDCRICCNPIHMRLHLDEARKCIQLYIDGDDEQLY